MDRHPRANQTGVSRLSRNETEAQKDGCEMGSLQTSRGCCHSPPNNNSSSSRHRRSSSRGSGGKSSFRYVQPANSSTSSSTVRCAMKMITNITDNNLLYNLRSPKNQQQTLTDTSFVVRVSPRNALATKWMYRELRKKKQIPTKRKRERERCISLSPAESLLFRRRRRRQQQQQLMAQEKRDRVATDTSAQREGPESCW